MPLQTQSGIEESHFVETELNTVQEKEDPFQLLNHKNPNLAVKTDKAIKFNENITLLAKDNKRQNNLLQIQENEEFEFSEYQNKKVEKSAFDNIEHTNSHVKSESLISVELKRMDNVQEDILQKMIHDEIDKIDKDFKDLIDTCGTPQTLDVQQQETGNQEYKSVPVHHSQQDDYGSFQQIKSNSVSKPRSIVQGSDEEVLSIVCEQNLNGLNFTHQKRRDEDEGNGGHRADSPMNPSAQVSGLSEATLIQVQQMKYPVTTTSHKVIKNSTFHSNANMIINFNDADGSRGLRNNESYSKTIPSQFSVEQAQKVKILENEKTSEHSKIVQLQKQEKYNMMTTVRRSSGDFKHSLTSNSAKKKFYFHPSNRSSAYKPLGIQSSIESSRLKSSSPEKIISWNIPLFNDANSYSVGKGIQGLTHDKSAPNLKQGGYNNILGSQKLKRDGSESRFNKHK